MIHVDVIAVGLASPLGLGALATAAALRANLRSIYRLEQGEAIEAQIQSQLGEPARASRLIELGPKLRRSQRASFFAHRALSELAVALEPILSRSGHADSMSAIPSYIALPEPRDAAGYDPAQVFAPVAGVFGSARLYPSGRAGVLEAVRDAARALERGPDRLALVGAADSMTDAATMLRLAKEGRLLSRANPDGSIPGEGAAFFVLARTDPDTSTRAVSLARLGPHAEAVEPHPAIGTTPSTAAGLTEAFAGLRRAGLGRVELVHSAQPTQRHWASELGYAAIRNAALMPEPLVHKPRSPASRDPHTRLVVRRCADALGELGCAASAVSFVLATIDFHALIPRSTPSLEPLPRSALVYACSDAGSVQACALTSPA